MRFALAAVAVALVTCGVGCASKAKRVSSDEELVVDAKRVSYFDIKPAIDDMCRKISERNAAGWPPKLLKAEDNSGKPIIALSRLKNESGDASVNMEAFVREIENTINEQGVCYLTNSGKLTADDAAAVSEERAYADATEGDSEAKRLEEEDKSGLVLTGLLSRDRQADEDMVVYRYTFQFKLTDKIQNRPVITTSIAFTKAQER